MMQYVASFVSNFLDSKLCLGFTHDVVGEGDGTPFQYSWLENLMDGVAW